MAMNANLRQLLVVLSVMLSILAGVPVWWSMTRIRRPSLPKEQIHKAASIFSSTQRQSMEVLLLIHSFLPEGSQSQSKIAAEVHKAIGVIQLGFIEVDLAVKIVEKGASLSTASKCLLDGGDLSTLASLPLSDVASKMSDCFSSEGNNTYHLVVFQSGFLKTEEYVVHGHVSWMTTKAASLLQCSSEVSENSRLLMRRVYFKPPILPSQFVNKTLAAEKDERHISDESPVVTSSDLTLVFTLCNSDANNGFWLWDFQQIENEWLACSLAQLTPFLNIELESQVIFDCDITVELAWDKQLHSFVLYEEETPFFVNSEWDVDPSGKVSSGGESGGMAPHVLHFVVYIPPRNRHPLTIRSSKRTSQSFLLSAWGGLVILNKEYIFDTSDASKKADLTETDHQAISQAALSQLRLLLGLTPATVLEENQVLRFRSKHEAFTQDEIEHLMMTKLLRDMQSSSRILSALDRLVDAIPNLEIPNLIQHQALQSLHAFETAQEKVAGGDLRAAVFHASFARRLAEKAFSHPAIVSRENFPDEHKIGIYVPLFFPVLLSIIVTSITQIQSKPDDETRLIMKMSRD